MGNIIHGVCSFEIEVYYIDITALLCCFLFGPSVNIARNQTQMAPCASELQAPTQVLGTVS